MFGLCIRLKLTLYDYAVQEHQTCAKIKKCICNQFTASVRESGISRPADQAANYLDSTLHQLTFSTFLFGGLADEENTNSTLIHCLSALGVYVFASCVCGRLYSQSRRDQSRHTFRNRASIGCICARGYHHRVCTSLPDNPNPVSD